MTDTNIETRTGIFRKIAEELQKKKVSEGNSFNSDVDYPKLIHELAVRQIELELENKELKNEKEHANVALKESVEKFEIFFASIEQGLALHKVITDSEGSPVDFEYLYFNDSFTKMFGVQSDAIGKCMKEVWPNIEQHFLDTFYNVVLTGESISYESYFEVTGRYYFTYAYCPKKDRFAVIIADITKRKLAEVEILESRERYSALLNAMPDMMFLIDRNGFFVDYAGGANSSFLTAPDLFLSKNVNDVLPPEIAKLTNNKLKKVFESKQNQIYEYELEIDNKLKCFESRLVPCGESKCFSIVRDVTEKKNMIDDLLIAKNLAEQSEKLKDSFIANMSHEIRTPLNGILGMTSIIKEVFTPYITGKEEKYFISVDKSCDRIQRTIDMILNYSRLHIGAFTIKPENVEVSQICECLLEEFERDACKKSIRLSFENRAGEVIVFIDKDSITQSISGLIDNAIKFTESGSVIIELDKGENNEIYLSVKDSGVGISQEYLTRIFEPYSQEHISYGRAYDGVGLNLAIIKKLIDLNHAAISVKSRKGKGTIFTINLGREVRTEGEIISDSDEIIESNKLINHFNTPWSISSNYLVLMVEDDEINQDLGRLFVAGFFDILIAGSADQAMEILRNNKVDIILMDISINGAKNGLQLTAELKANEKFLHIPIIAISAHALPEDRKNSFAAGCDDYMTKPYRRFELLDIIGKHLK